MSPSCVEWHSCLQTKQKLNNHPHLGRKLENSLPDFARLVVSRFWKSGKRAVRLALAIAFPPYKYACSVTVQA
ncbi:hypothetical protein DBY68_004295 [Pseudocitrobacter sp. RIT415]|nr:hypothetical protein DBY68_004295 [Pseudocitrobacter sp. RIT 415]